MKRSVARSPLAFLLLALSPCARPADAQLSISDDGAVFEIPGASDFLGLGGTWNCDFRTDGGSIDHLFQIGWAVRFPGQTGQSRLGVPDSAVASGDTLALAYDDVGSRGIASAVVELVVDGRNGGSEATLLARVTLANRTATARAIGVVFYADPDLHPDALDDATTPGGTFGDSILLDDSGPRSFELRGVDHDAREVRGSSSLRTEALSTVVSFDADGSGTPSAPSDARVAFQWYRVLPANGTLVLEAGAGLDATAVPVEISEFRID